MKEGKISVVVMVVKLGLLLGAMVGSILPGQEVDTTASAGIHAPYDEILQKYVVGTRFDYEAISKNPADLEKLHGYVDFLETLNPEEMSRNDALAYWINLYNAATLELVLKNYPVKSIKAIGWYIFSPWEKNVVKVNGQWLTLNQIENEIIRPRFKDARIHFALNCASIGCPPLANHAYVGAKLDQQLDAAVRRALNDDHWVRVETDRILLTAIFNWYQQDFVEYAGSVRQFIARYREKDKQAILDESRPLEYMDYNWNLNKVE